jgi:hypothetical protein
MPNKKCMFCGKEALYIDEIGREPEYWVSCGACGAQGPSADSPEGAWDSWHKLHYRIKNEYSLGFTRGELYGLEQQQSNSYAIGYNAGLEAAAKYVELPSERLLCASCGEPLFLGVLAERIRRLRDTNNSGSLSK